MKVIIKNSELVFQRKHVPVIVYKNYWVRGSGQYINLTGINNITSYAYDNLIVDAEIYIGKSAFSQLNCVTCSRANNFRLLTMSPNKFGWANSGYSGSSYVMTDPSVGDYHIIANNKTGTITVNNSDFSFTAPGNGTLNYLWMFASGSNNEDVTANTYDEGASKVARLKIYNATTNDLILDIRPALVDNVPCLYESVTGTKLFSEDGTSLVVE